VLGHHNINPLVAWAVNRVRTTFTSEIGNTPKVIEGTGFWLKTTDAHTVFITNKHNVDPSLLFPKDGDLRLKQIELALRRGCSDTAPVDLVYHPGDFLACANVKAALFSMEWDVAVLVDPVFENPDATTPPPELLQRPLPFISEADLADREWFRTIQTMMDECFFIGYPGTPADSSKSRKTVLFYDTFTKFPIARHAVIASPPDLPFQNEHIKTGGVLLVSGMSFHGSSGSPVFTPVLGIPPGGDIRGAHRPARVIGIMTGKFETMESGADFIHAGLSYFTMSSCIRRVIQLARESNWRKTA
jgi:hypothetical protein